MKHKYFYKRSRNINSMIKKKLKETIFLDDVDFSDKKSLKKHANGLKSEFNLGKSGITETFIKSVDDFLEAHKIVKIKALIAEDKEAMKFYAEELAKETDSEILEVKGFTFVLFRDKK